jgi:hypothetical protein
MLHESSQSALMRSRIDRNRSIRRTLASSSSVAGGWLETIHGVKAALVDPGAALDVLSAI